MNLQYLLVVEGFQSNPVARESDDIFEKDVLLDEEVSSDEEARANKRPRVNDDVEREELTDEDEDV